MSSPLYKRMPHCAPSNFGQKLFCNRGGDFGIVVVSMAAGELVVARFRLKVNPPTELRNRHDCTRLLRQHLDPAAYRSIGKKNSQEQWKGVLF